MNKNITPEMISAAVEELGVLKFFPGGPGEREAVMNLLERIVDRGERLRWLVDTLVNYVGEWPGSGQCRALYATRFAPADGVEGPHCTIVGFTPTDSERAFLEGHENLKIEGVRAPGMKRIAAAQKIH